MPWLRMRNSKRQKLFVCVDEQGEVVVEAGRARTRYKLDDNREYSARAQDLKPIPGETPLDLQLPEPKTSKASPVPQNLELVERPKSIPEHPPEGVIMAFTDGAARKNPGKAGAGLVLCFGEHRLEQGRALGISTNNIAELTAIKMALEAVKNTAIPLHIYTDSSYSIGVLGKGWKAQKNQELIAEIKTRLVPFKKVTLFKVKGHAGHPLNERADQLATQAADSQENTETRSSSEPLSPAKTPAQRKTQAPPAKSKAQEPTPRGKASSVTVYTDGASLSNPGPAGLGVVILLPGGETKELSESLGKATNNVAELTAIKRALEEVPPTTQHITLHTDSRYAIGVLEGSMKARANRELISATQALMRRFELHFVWVKGHAGNPLNERADELASAAAKIQQ